MLPLNNTPIFIFISPKKYQPSCEPTNYLTIQIKIYIHWRRIFPLFLFILGKMDIWPQSPLILFSLFLPGLPGDGRRRCSSCPSPPCSPAAPTPRTRSRNCPCSSQSRCWLELLDALSVSMCDVEHVLPDIPLDLDRLKMMSSLVFLLNILAILFLTFISFLQSLFR